MEEVNKEGVETRNLNFLEEIIEADLASGKCESVMTRFPPEPNGYQHKDIIPSKGQGNGCAPENSGRAHQR